MRSRGSHIRLPFISLLLFLSSLPITAIEAPPNSVSHLLPRDTAPIPQPPTAKRPDVGTKDAPVDGLDGKPHAGPFVNPRDQSKYDQVGAGATTEKQNPEAGVMNDPNRTPPKKGTTGTEGGVSEKERDRKALESETGRIEPKTPDSPKDNPPSQTLGGKKLDGDYGSSRGATDMKADHLDDAHKDVASRLQSYGYGANGYPTVEKDPAREHDDEDDDDDDDEEDEEDEYDDQEGIHDIIPWDSLAGSFSSIAATEIGDKTFIVAALMAMRHSRLLVFSAAYSALFIMTLLSGVAGHIVGAIVSKRWSALLAALLFLAFGAKSLREGFAMSPAQGVNDEIREVQAELEEKEEDMARQTNGHRRKSSISPYALEAGRAAANGRKSRSDSRLAAPQRSPSSSASRSRSRARRPTLRTAVSGFKNLLGLLLSPAWVETFSMTFVGELGDRSQIATVAMAAGQEYFWVMVGASLGHMVCTGVAVLGGSVLAGRVSVRKVTLIGGGIFIGFGFFTLIEAAQYWF